MPKKTKSSDPSEVPPGGASDGEKSFLDRRGSLHVGAGAVEDDIRKARQQRGRDVRPTEADEEEEDDLRKEYDLGSLTGGVRGKYYARLSRDQLATDHSKT